MILYYILQALAAGFAIAALMVDSIKQGRRLLGHSLWFQALGLAHFLLLKVLS
jgi:hypothetical protein